jgi:hypothetical protein
VEVHGNIQNVGIVVVDQTNHQLVGVTVNIAFNGFAPHVATVTVVVDPVAAGTLASQLIEKKATSVLRVTGLQSNDPNIINKVLSGLQLFEEDLSTINFSATDSSGEKAFSLDLVALVGSDPNVTTKNIKLRADFSFSSDILLNGTVPSTTNCFLHTLMHLGLSLTGSSQLGDILTAVTDPLTFKLNPGVARHSYSAYVTIMQEKNVTNLVQTVNNIMLGLVINVGVRGTGGISGNAIQHILENVAISLDFTFANQSAGGASKVQGGN